MKDYTVLIIGGGASGMMCALRLAEGGVRNIALIEKMNVLAENCRRQATARGM